MRAKLEGYIRKIITYSLNFFFYFLISAERLRLQYTNSEETQVFNNTYINSFIILARSKREISFSVDCFGAQGDHNPVWKTDNPMLGDETGAIVADSGSGVSALLSNYSARFQLFLVTPEVNGTYSCVSQRSGLISQFFLTTGEHLYLANSALHICMCYLWGESEF